MAVSVWMRIYVCGHVCPLQVSYADCQAIVSTCLSSHVILAVCHVLRYTPQAKKIQELIESGVIGEVMNIQLLEPVQALSNSIVHLLLYLHRLEHSTLLIRMFEGSGGIPIQVASAFWLNPAMTLTSFACGWRGQSAPRSRLLLPYSTSNQRTKWVYGLCLCCSC